MIKTTLPKRELHNARGGNGTIIASDIGSREDSYGHLSVFSIMHLEPGVSMGYHEHPENTEYYYILSGTPTVSDNGVECVMHPGEMMLTGNGDGHSIENRTDEPVEFLAVIVEK